MHLFKGNVGTGIFAMGDAFRNGGILVASGLTLLLGMICTYNMHILVSSALFFFLSQTNKLRDNFLNFRSIAHVTFKNVTS